MAIQQLILTSSLVGYSFLTLAPARGATATLPYHRYDVGVGRYSAATATATGFVGGGNPNRNDNRSLLREVSKQRSSRRRLLAISSSKSSDNVSFSSSRRKPFPPIDGAFAQRQISKIFGSSSSFGDNKMFVPLSLAGRWTSLPSNQTSQNNGRIDMIWLSTQDECQSIADAFDQFLLMGGSGDGRGFNINSRVQTTMTGLPIPLSPSLSQSAIKLLAQTYSSKPISKSLLLVFNSLLVNRDGGVFDNLPWSTWTIDPTRYEKDAADNVLEVKYTMGKRVAYQRFMGKDWKGRSLSLGNLANRLRYYLEKEETEEADTSTRKGATKSKAGDFGNGVEGMQSMVDEELGVGGGEDDRVMMMMSLSQRLLQLEIKEATMEIAECDQQLAIIATANARGEALLDVDDERANNNEDDAEASALKRMESARERLMVAESSLKKVMDASLTCPSVPAVQTDTENSGTLFSMFDVFPWKTKTNERMAKRNTNAQSLLRSILDKLTEQDNPPPYRGAIGYPPILDSKEEMFEQSILPYSSPYELLLEIIYEQLNSVVLGCVLENTSLLDGNLVLGGALLLQRKGVPKSSTVLGEIVTYTDDDDDLGNDGVLPKSMYVVECFVDEVVGVALASGVPIFVEQGLYNRAGGRSAELDIESVEEVAASFVTFVNTPVDVGVGAAMNRIPPIRPMDEFLLSPQIEGGRVSSENESNRVRIPLTTSPSVLDGFPTTTSSGSSRSVFSTFSPVNSLDQYDNLTDDAKVRLLLKLESFTGSLPRPRAVKTSIASTSRGEYDDGLSPPSLLDELLVPLIDESIRRQYRIRDAERRKDYAEAAELRAQISPRQAALEKAQRAREEGLDEKAVQLEEEADLYKALRADITQDESAYDRFLDRDEWYERETRARLKRLDKSKFGTLLDGVDLP